MSKQLSLISVQTVHQFDNILEQVKSYFQDLSQYLIKNEDELLKHPTICSFPEYSFGNNLRSNTNNDFKDISMLIKDFITEFKVKIVAGSLAVNEEGNWYNRSYVFDNNSKIAGFYDKKYLFNYEKKTDIIQGNQSGIIKFSNDLNVQILICSDLWYPELIRKNLTENISCVIVPAMSVVQNKNLVNYGNWLWESLAITRSRENVIPLMVSDWAVQDLGKSATCGASSIINPSIRWTKEKDKQKAIKKFNDMEKGIISSVISLEDIETYRNYRIDVGLLPG